jgi:hypothetical protein
MDLKKLSSILMILGAGLAVAAVIWWYAFYSRIIGELNQLTPGSDTSNSSVLDALSCLYSGGGVCSLVTGLASLAGKTPYEPMVLWLGIGVLVGGLIVRFARKSS